MSIIPTEYYGENSPVLALNDMSGNESFQIPKYEEKYTPDDILQMVLGKKDGFNQGLLSEPIKQWFKKIHQYLDVPLLEFFANEKFDMNSKNWWEKFMKCAGFTNFLYKYTGKFDANIALYYACSNGHLECAKWCVEKGATKCSWCNGINHNFTQH